MGRLTWRARGYAVRRRGRSVGHAHRAIGGQLLGTLIRHALAPTAAILALAIAVIGAPFVAGLVTGVGTPPRQPVADRAARLVAVDLPPVMTATQVEDPGARRAVLRSKPLVLL
jgi:hypothetical protein